MQRKLALPLALFFIMLIIFAGCAHEVPQKKQIKSFYEEFIEVDLLDPVRAIEEYEHYNDETLKAVAIDSVKGNYTTHYEILSLEKITDQLWVIELYIECKRYNKSRPLMAKTLEKSRPPKSKISSPALQLCYHKK